MSNQQFATLSINGFPDIPIAFEGLLNPPMGNLGFQVVWPPASHLPFVHLKGTYDLEAMDRAVYSEELLAQQYVGRNPRLTEAHCRHLITKLTESLDRALLIHATSFPTDLLYRLALSEVDPFVLEFIASHPNADEETRTILALRRLQ